MALETLEEIRVINGFGVREILDGGAMNTTEDRFITVDHRDNSVKFKIQNGPINESEINGCQVDTIIETAKLIIEGLNKKFPCEENTSAISYLESALGSLRSRTRDREARKVEGTSNA